MKEFYENDQVEKNAALVNKFDGFQSILLPVYADVYTLYNNSTNFILHLQHFFFSS